jgi:hypothetical protein
VRHLNSRKRDLSRRLAIVRPQAQQTNGGSTCSHAPILPAATCRSRLPNPEYRIEVIAVPPPAIQPNRPSDMPQVGDIEVVRLGDLRHDGRNAHRRQQ